MKKSIIFTTSFFFFFILFAEDGILPPSNYVGMHNQWLQYENGKIPFDSTALPTKYTGEWIYKNASGTQITRGYYSNGIPCGTWIIYNETQMPSVAFNYGDGTYMETCYYPDGLVGLQQIGKLRITPDLFLHEPGEIKRWDLVGNYVDEKAAMSTGWSWCDRLDNGHCGFVVGTYLFECYYYVVSSNALQVACYISNKTSFIGKIVDVYIVNKDTGKLDVTHIQTLNIADLSIALSCTPLEKNIVADTDGQESENECQKEIDINIDIISADGEMKEKLWACFIKKM